MSDSAPSSFLEAAAGLAPRIRSCAEEIEQSRRLPLPLVEAITQAGLFRLWIPRSLGGEETDPMTFVRVVEEVSRADGAVGWRVAIGAEWARLAGICRPKRLVKSSPEGRGVSALRKCHSRRRRLSGDRTMAAWQWLSAFRLDRRGLPHSGRRSAAPQT